MNRPATLVAYRAFSDVAGKGAFLLVTVFAARRLTQHGFGVFSLATTVGWMAAVAADFGIQLHLARGVARQPERSAELLRRWLRVRLWTSAAILSLVVALVSAIGVDRTSSLAIVLITVVYLIGGLVEFLHYFYRGLSRTDIESTLTLCQRFGMLVSAAAVLAWRPDVLLLGFALLVPSAATLGYSLRRAAAVAESGRPGATRHEHAGSTTAVATTVTGELRRVLPIGIGLILSSLYFRIDVFLIELWNGTDAVALYNAMFRIVDALRLFPAAVLAVALPALFRATDARPLVGIATIVTAFSLVVSVVLWLAADWLIPALYGAPYAGAVPAFRILLASLPLMSLNYALTHQLVGWNGHRAWAAIAGAALVVNLALNARLIPAFSIAGAAWSTLATEVVLTVACACALRARSVRESRAAAQGPPDDPTEGTLPATVSA